LDDEVIKMSLQSSDKESMLISAQHFEQKKQYEQAVILYNKCGNQQKAIELCFKYKLFELLRNILDDLKDINDKELLSKVCKFFISNNQYDKAVSIMTKLGDNEQAMILIQKFNVILDDELADRLTPEIGSMDNNKRNQILLELGKIAKRQQN